MPEDYATYAPISKATIDINNTHESFKRADHNYSDVLNHQEVAPAPL
jgi:hypothetical protein